jgi:hypothetical protein
MAAMRKNGRSLLPSSTTQLRPLQPLRF